MNNTIHMLIDACRRVDGGFGPFIQFCIKDPESYFKKKNLLNEYNSQPDEYKECFKKKEKFFNLLVEVKIKTSDNCRSIDNKCEVCGRETEFISVYEGYKRTCCKECDYEDKKRVYYNTPEEIRKDRARRIGVSHKNKTKEEWEVIVNKRKNTISGIENYYENKKLRTENSNLKKFGVRYYQMTKEWSDKMSNIWSNKTPEEIQESTNKGKETKLKNHGDPNYNNWEKGMETKIKKYGVACYLQKNFTNLDKVNDIDFLAENFTYKGKIVVKKLKKFFNIKQRSIILDGVIEKLEEKGFVLNKTHHKLEEDFLIEIETKLGIILERKHIVWVDDKKYYKLDGYNPKTKTIYEFHGDYWHGNPEKFDQESINLNNSIKYRELYVHTIERMEHLKSMGYKIFYIWEKDYLKTSLENLREF